jgi:hypothetical protein
MQECSDKRNLISSNNIKSIVITLDSSQHNIASNPIEITSQDSLYHIIQELNASDQEPIKFYPTHWLKINYSNGQEKAIFCSGSSMKYEGRTYRLKESIRNIIGY